MSTLHEMLKYGKFLGVGGSGGGGATSWNNLTDKPFYDLPTGGDTLTWDGNTEGRYLVDYMGYYAHISDAVPTINDLANGMSITVLREGVQRTGTLTADQFYDDGGVIIGESLGKYAYFVSEEAVTEHSEDPNFPQKAGTYFSFDPYANRAMASVITLSITIPGYTGYPSAKKLDKKYLPISGWEDLGREYDVAYALPETTPAFNEDEGYFTLPKPFTIYKGETYTVNWNGTGYTCQCVSATFSGLPILGLGNIGAVTGGASTGEPFAIGVILEEYRDKAPFAVGIIPLDNSESVTLSVYGYTEIITPIPEKYLPDGGGVGQYVVDFTLDTSEGYTRCLTDKSFGEVRNAINSGTVPVIARLVGDGTAIFHVANYGQDSIEFTSVRVASGTWSVMMIQWIESNGFAWLTST